MLYIWTLTEVLQVKSACLFKAPTLIQGLFLRTTADLQGQVENEAPLEKLWKKTNEIPPKNASFFFVNCDFGISSTRKGKLYLVHPSEGQKWSFIVFAGGVHLHK